MTDFRRRVVRPKRSFFGIFAYLAHPLVDHVAPLPTADANMFVWWNP